MTKMMANQSFDSVHALYGCPVRLFVLKTSKQLPNKARKKNKKNKKKKKNGLKQKKKTSLKKNMFFYISIGGYCDRPTLQTRSKWRLRNRQWK